MVDVKLEKSNNNRYRAYKFSLAIIDFVKNFSQNKINLIFIDQLLRSATSVGANLIEGKYSNSKRDFARYHEMALRSCNETLYWLCLLRDSKIVINSNVGDLISEAKEISKMIASSLLTLRGKRKI